jgi:hypothetical protein
VWKKVWRLKCPSKAHIFMWLLLNNKVLSWDNLQKRNTQCPGWCIFCTDSEETNFHLNISYAFSNQVWRKLNYAFSNQFWKEVEGITGFKDVWNGDYIEAGLRGWCENENVKGYRALPVIIA